MKQNLKLYCSPAYNVPGAPLNFTTKPFNKLLVEQTTLNSPFLHKSRIHGQSTRRATQLTQLHYTSSSNGCSVPSYHDKFPRHAPSPPQPNQRNTTTRTHHHSSHYNRRLPTHPTPPPRHLNHPLPTIPQTHAHTLYSWKAASKREPTCEPKPAGV